MNYVIQFATFHLLEVCTSRRLTIFLTLYDDILTMYGEVV